MQLVDIFSQDSITILSRSWPRDSSQELGILPELGCDSSKILRETEILICGRRRKAEGGGGRGGERMWRMMKSGTKMIQPKRNPTNHINQLRNNWANNPVIDHLMLLPLLTRAEFNATTIQPSYQYQLQNKHGSKYNYNSIK